MRTMPAPNRRFTRAVAALGLAMLCGPAAAVPFTVYGFPGDTTSSGVFTVACGGPADGGLFNSTVPDNRGFFKSGSTCTADALTPDASATFSSGSVSTTAIATAALGSIAGASTMITGAQSTVLFPAGFTDAGWIDTLLISNPSFDNQIATVTVAVDVDGSLFADGPNVFSRFAVVVASELGGSDQKTYQVQAGVNANTSVDEILTFDLLFRVGTPSQFMVRGLSEAMTSSATSFGDNVSNTLFGSTVDWAGIQKVTVGGQDIAFTALGLDTGIDWSRPFSAVGPSPVPVPHTLTLVVLALATLRPGRRPRPG